MNRRALLLGLALTLLGCREPRPPEPPPGDSPKAKAPEPRKPGPLSAGVARVEITNKKVLPLNDPLYVKALVLRSDDATVVLVTLDAVAVGEIGHIGNDYLGKVRARLQKELGIAPESVVVNASHCHGVVCADVDDKTVEAVKS